jgi:hypothetical protein
MRWDLMLPNPEEADWHDLLIMQTYVDNAYRGIIFVTSLTIAVLAYARTFNRYALIAICLMLVLITTGFALYVITTSYKMMRHIPGYSKIYFAYYITATILLLSLAVFITIRIDWDHLRTHKKFKILHDDDKSNPSRES